jgi:hypothetical protein
MPLPGRMDLFTGVGFESTMKDPMVSARTEHMVVDGEEFGVRSAQVSRGQYDVEWCPVRTPG